MRKIFCAICILLTLFCGRNAAAKDITLRLPWFDTKQHEYFYELLRQSLELCGHTLFFDPVRNYPYQRLVHLVETGQMDAIYLIQTEERDNKFVPVPVGLTNKLIGHRVMLVRPGTEHEYCGVETLEDFRSLGKVGGHGIGWFDAKVWRHNDLPVNEQANWRLFYPMIAEGNRKVDYFARGFVEVLEEVRHYPMLTIEPNLLLVYDRDFIFYLSKEKAHLQPLFTEALTKARDSGLMDRLLYKYLKESFDVIRPESRIKLILDTPPE